MMGNFFGGLFGSQNPALDMNQGADALGQAAAGAPMAMGNMGDGDNWLSGLMSKFNSMDPQAKQLMFSRIKDGFGRGMGGAANAQVPQVRNVYQPMTQAQPGMMFNPYGGR